MHASFDFIIGLVWELMTKIPRRCHTREFCLLLLLSVFFNDSALEVHNCLQCIKKKKSLKSHFFTLHTSFFANFFRFFIFILILPNGALWGGRRHFKNIFVKHSKGHTASYKMKKCEQVHKILLLGDKEIFEFYKVDRLKFLSVNCFKMSYDRVLVEF